MKTTPLKQWALTENFAGICTVTWGMVRDGRGFHVAVPDDEGHGGHGRKIGGRHKEHQDEQK